MISPHLPPEFHGDDLPPKRAKASVGPADKKIADVVVDKLLDFGGTSPDVMRKIIGDASKLSRAELMQRTDLKEIEVSVQKIQKEYCKGIMGRVKSLFGQTFEGKCAKILRSVNTAKNESEQDALQLMESHPFLLSITDKSQQAQVLDAIKEMPVAERTKFVQQLQVLLEGTTSKAQMVLLGMIKEMPQAERTEFIDQLPDVLKGAASDERIAVVSVIKEMPRAERAEFIKQLPDVLKGAASNERITIVNMIKEMPRAERAEFIEQLQVLLKGVDANERIAIVGMIKEMPQASRGEFIEQLQVLLTEVASHEAL